MSGDHPDHEITLALHAETIEVGHRAIEKGTVRVETVVRTRDAVIDELLAREDVVIERVDIRQIVDRAPGIREEGDTIIVPVIEEVLVTERRLFLKEEVRIRRVRTTERYQEVVALREEDAVVTRIASSRATQDKTADGETAMASETIVAVFDTPAHAELAIADLTRAGIPTSAIEHFAQVDGDASGEVSTIETGKPHKGFWSWLTGEEDDRSVGHHTVYDNSMASGHTVVTVVVDATRADDVMSLLDEHDPIDIDAHHGMYGEESAVATTAPSLAPVDNAVPVAAVAPAVGMPVAEPGRGAAGEEVISLSEETLEVGKRAVERGTTRVRRFVVERPVEEQIRLRDEHVSVFRRPVTGVGARVGGDAFSEKIVEMTETGEEAVVGKTSHVVEEVVIKKEMGERVETIHDTLRREDVEIQGGSSSVGAAASVPSDGLKPV